MNINLAHYGEDDGEELIEMLDTHVTVLARTTSYTFSGRQALLPETDLPDAYRVWNETMVGTWVWVNTEGELIETAEPMKHREP